jgi:hypothetical protein
VRQVIFHESCAHNSSRAIASEVDFVHHRLCNVAVYGVEHVPQIIDLLLKP